MLDSKPSATNPEQPGLRKSREVYTAALVLAAAIFAIWHALPPLYPLASGVTISVSKTDSSCAASKSKWQWTDVTPSKDLDWQPCYDGFECTRLDVPLDWLDPSEDSRAVLAVIRLPASNKTDYKGPVLMNPGGPGGSGIWSLRDHGRSLQTIVGKNHDIISWDPRGVGASIPQIDCWSSKQRGRIWSLQDAGVADSHPGVLYDAYARSVAASQTCSSAMPGLNSPLKFVSTASTARDMLEILDKTGWSKLKYWGFSYGTVLGVTFASMYPEKIDRMVNDGNVDLTEWTSGGHINFMTDTDKVMAAFYRFCHLAGPSDCALYSSTPAGIEARMQNVLANLKIHPVIIPAPANSMDLPELITYSSLKRLISSALYRPVFMFPSLAEVVASLEVGNGMPFIKLVTSQGTRKQFSCECEVDGSSDEAEGTDDAFPGIMCSDGEEMTGDVEDFEQYANHIMNQSKAAGAVNLLFRISCAGWHTRPKWRYTGPFIGNTSTPLLFIANTADNVTPKRSAMINARGFNGSVVLTQDSYGHTSLTAPSSCTAKHIRAYFQDGVLPKPETKCPADIQPFQQPATEKTNDADAELREALMRLTKWKSFSGSI